MGTNTTAPTVRFDPGSQEFAWHAYERYAELREQSPVLRLLQPDGTEVWLVTRYEEARAALADRRLSKDPRVVRRALEQAGLDPEAAGRAQPTDADDALGSEDQPPPTAKQPRKRRTDISTSSGLPTFETPGMMSSDPPDHDEKRRLFSRTFTPRRVELLRPRIEAIAEQLLDEMEGEDEVDLLSAYAWPLPTTVICELVGAPVTDGVRIRRWLEINTSTDPEVVPPDPSEEIDDPEFKGDIQRQYASQLIRATTPHVRHDVTSDEQPSLLHALLASNEGQDRLTHVELVANLSLLLAAGSLDPALLIGNGLLALLRHPGQRDLLRQHPDLLPNAIEELLRYDGPDERGTFRFSLEPLTVGGVTIPAHRMVGVVIASANRDPRQFESPDELDIKRPRPHHLGFGHGIHSCLGAPLGRLEAQIAIGGLLERFPDMELACPIEDLRFRFAGYVVRGLDALPVRLHGNQ